MLEIKEGKNHIICSIRVQPRASKSEICGVLNNSLKLKLTSPPVDNAANRACIEYFSKLTGVSKSKITIVGGIKRRDKKVRIEGITRNEFLGIVKHEGINSV